MIFIFMSYEGDLEEDEKMTSENIRSELQAYEARLIDMFPVLKNYPDQWVIVEGSEKFKEWLRLSGYMEHYNEWVELDKDIFIIDPPETA